MMKFKSALMYRSNFPFKINLLVFVTLSIVLFSCAEESGKAEDEVKIDSIEEKGNNLFLVSGKVFSVPSPIQTAFLLKKSGTEYKPTMLASVSKADEQATTFEKALILGLYGADLAYVSIYNQNQDAISYIKTVKQISNDLNISGIFDESMITKYEKNVGNEDSLMAMVSEAFQLADGFLKENEQEDLSVMVLAGGWVEMLYFATNIVNESQNQDVLNRIGEQKVTIQNLIKLLVPFRSNQAVSRILNKLNELENIYDDIEFSYTYKEPITDEEAKITHIKSESSVKMSDEQLTTITQKINEIREDILN